MIQSIRALFLADGCIMPSDTAVLWVSCSGETPADTESLGTAELHPWQGIPFMYFPVRQDSNPQTIPLLALKLNNPQRKSCLKLAGLISIRCHFWAKNLDSQHIAAASSYSYNGRTQRSNGL
ncbi:Sodium/potassium-transporting ATPase subunit beta-2 [Chionoecetes opilio]|uniref:Sodium/potassium-transporting ATPase subunit beta-2 n=1 Tax=Chionoecetes opilio TaxID=41210 RepID=A0A8J4YPC5_CHIOP|nr:Sodium/potassium-transporting ATPase subunit beta-2 [Chionoecetes opilio]